MHAWRWQQCVKGFFGQQCTLPLVCVKASTQDQEGAYHCLHTLCGCLLTLTQVATLPSPPLNKSGPMHASSAVDPLTFASTLMHYIGKFLSNQHYAPHPRFSLRPQISLRFTTDRTLPSSEQRNPFMHERFSPLNVTTVPFCNTSACTLNPFVRFFFFLFFLQPWKEHLARLSIAADLSALSP